MRRHWKTLVLLSVLVLVAAVLLIAPGMVDADLNKVLTTSPPSPSAEALALHRTLFVADLHADQLLWSRDPLARSTRGHVEGLHALDGSLANVDTLYAAGFRMMGLTHFFDNELGGSAHGITHGGLTPLGRDVVTRMEALGISWASNTWRSAPTSMAPPPNRGTPPRSAC